LISLALYLIVIAAVFGLCYFLDKGFQKVFRSKAQHHTGLAVRLNKLYSIAGVLLSVLGVIAAVNGIQENKALLYGGIFVFMLGIGLCIYHLSFGLFYDEESYVYTSLGKKETTYRYSDILTQKLYIITGGSVVVELHMADGKAVSVQSNMDGVYPFLDAAFSGWCRQKGIDAKSCEFHDPANHLWFPTEDL
jgi:hypothetical protein